LFAIQISLKAIQSANLGNILAHSKEGNWKFRGEEDFRSLIYFRKEQCMMMLNWNFLKPCVPVV